MMLVFRRSFVLFCVLSLLGSTAWAWVPQDQQRTTKSQTTETETSDERTSAGTTPTDSEPVATGLTSDASLPLVAFLIPLLGIAGLVFTFWKSSWVAKQEAGTDRMIAIANNITEGAMSFLKTAPMSVV